VKGREEMQKAIAALEAGVKAERLPEKAF